MDYVVVVAGTKGGKHRGTLCGGNLISLFLFFRVRHTTLYNILWTSSCCQRYQSLFRRGFPARRHLAEATLDWELERGGT
jgi:hypothetical protein